MNASMPWLSFVIIPFLRSVLVTVTGYPYVLPARRPDVHILCDLSVVELEGKRNLEFSARSDTLACTLCDSVALESEAEQRTQYIRRTSRLQQTPCFSFRPPHVSTEVS